MFEAYRHLIHKYPKISLYQERRLIKQAQEGSKAKRDELVERHIRFVIFRINKIAFPAYRVRFGQDILSEAIFILYDKIDTYDLMYKDKYGNQKPVRFSSYIWKRIDGFIIDYLMKELNRERQERSLDMGISDYENDALIYEELYK
jgi:DNA-directed RNA polymerase specialized sigma subunit